jgi:ubiquinone/menaquinone biosynthesis C-methylase UbiE
MTPEMVEKARENARRGGYGNVEFRFGEIENLPVADGTVDVILSNCVINLSPNKGRVFQEAFRVLKPGGRLMISDLVVVKPLSQRLRRSVSAYVGCVAGAIRKEEYLESLSAAGFREVAVVEETSFPVGGFSTDPLARGMIEEQAIPPEAIREVESLVSSIRVHGRKPAGKE